MISLRRSPEKVRLPLGFSFSAVPAGIKVSGMPDLALAEAAEGATAAALFTQNRVVAAPVEVGRAGLLSSRYRVRAVLVNSGNANCATGRVGIQACQQICRETATALGASANEIFPSSTGIIGVPLSPEKITVQLPKLIAARSANQRGVLAFAHAIMTTDTRAKIASARFRAGAGNVTMLGIAKGAGMIHPQLATMLVYLFTDVEAVSYTHLDVYKRQHLGRAPCRNFAASPGGVFLRRIWRARISAGLLRRSGSSGRRSYQERFRSWDTPRWRGSLDVYKRQAQ